MKKQALEARRGNIFFIRRGNIFFMDPDDLHLETDPAKKHYDANALLPFEEHVVAKMLEHGVKLTVLVEKLGDLVVVVDGNKRVTNAREAKRRQLAAGVPEGKTIMVPVRVERGSDVKLFEAKVIANEHRRPDSPITQAHKMQHYLDMGHSPEEAAGLFGVGPKTLERRLQLLELAPEVQAAVAAGTLTEGAARRLRGLPFDRQVARMNAPKEPRPKRPGKKKVQAALESLYVPEEFKRAVRWLRGELSDEEAGLG